MADIQLEYHTIESLISPWIIREYDPASLAWRRIWLREYARSSLRQFKKKTMPATGFGKHSFRTVNFVTNHYNRIWNRKSWPTHDGVAKRRDWTPVVWDDRAFVVWKGGITPMHLEIIARALEHLQPNTVLEVGTGLGTNLLSLSTRFPDIRFTGVELSEAGFHHARSVQDLDALPDSLANFFPRVQVDKTAFKRVEFTQGNAAKLNFSDNCFDLVFTKVALEQMESIRSQVLAEIARVGIKNTIMVEPFADFNQEPLPRLTNRAKEHFSLVVGELEQFNIKPMTVFNNWPRKANQGVGFVLSSL